MTPSGIRLKVVRERLGYAEECIRGLRSLPVGSREEFHADPRNAWSADALLRRAIEAIFDTTRHMVAKGFGEGRLEYKQVVQRATETGLVEKETGDTFFKIAGYRNRLAHHYEDVMDEELFLVVRDHLSGLETVITELRAAARRLATEPS